ncbi:hypothetical protein MINTM021_10490 [Mycobacterium paraintracellulare]|nr:hypothetical protein MINTM021_10490 [Mycobacterium paraintracellulare]
MNRADEGALAWTLADSATVFLKPADRARLCAKIGAGAQGSAIKDLLVFYANSGTELPCELAARVRAWIQGYAGSDSEPILRHIYDQIKVSVTNNASRQRPEVEAHRSPRRRIAKRSAHAAGVRATARASTYPIKRVAICGVTTSVEELVDAAVEARRFAQKAMEVAVREARSVDWSWDQIFAALGGMPNGGRISPQVRLPRITLGTRLMLGMEVCLTRWRRRTVSATATATLEEISLPAETFGQASYIASGSRAPAAGRRYSSRTHDSAEAGASCRHRPR